MSFKGGDLLRISLVRRKQREYRRMEGKTRVFVKFCLSLKNLLLWKEPSFHWEPKTSRCSASGSQLVYPVTVDKQSDA